jgi:hypothetical protein
MRVKRSPNLGEQEVQTIVGILDGWTGPLTWNLLIEAVASRLHYEYTRQALHKHERIRIAYEVRKKNRGLTEPKIHGSIQIQKALERISRLEAENQRLLLENERLNEKFVRWAFNAYVKGMAEPDLDRPLPQIDRRQTPVLVPSSKTKK